MCVCVCVYDGQGTIEDFGSARRDARVSRARGVHGKWNR